MAFLLIPLHPDDQLKTLKLDAYRKLATAVLLDSLLPGKEGSLKTRPDGLMLDGHHRIKVLRERGIDIDQLSREVIAKTEFEEPG
jgi:hypothetical protein